MALLLAAIFRPNPTLLLRKSSCACLCLLHGLRQSSYSPESLLSKNVLLGGSMDNHQIDNLLRRCKTTSKDYMGSFPLGMRVHKSKSTRLLSFLDMLPTIHTFPASLIVNLDKSSGPGTHWVAIYCPNANKACYFDSYGQEPPTLLRNYLKPFHVTYNTFVLQSIISSVCAHYCIYFIYQCSKGASYPTILTQLSKANNPDAYVSMFVKSLVE